MPLSGKALATAYVVIRADMSAVAGDIQKGTSSAVDTGARSASRKLKDAMSQPIREGLADGARQADAGGQAVGGRFRQGLTGKLRGIGTDTEKAGVDAGAGIDRGVSRKMRDVASTTAKGGKEAGEGFTKAAGDAADKGGKSLVRSVGGTASRMVGAFAAVEIGERSIEFFKGAIEGASDLAEAGNKLQVLFGPAAPQVQQWAATAATSLGMSKISAEDAAATFGVFAKSAGLASTDASGFAEKMTGLAGDLASFHNTSPEQAIEAIGAALRGESEPIRAYGILLDDATLRQRAMKLGIIDTTKNSLTPQQRVLAAQAEILAQTGAAQGDFARTSGGLANQQRILSAQFANAQAALGEKLLPVMLTGVSFLNSMVIPAFTGLLTVISHIPGPVVAAVAAVVGIGAAARVGKSALGQVSETAKVVGQAMQWMGLRTAGAAAAEGVQAAAAEAQVGANDAAAASTTRLGAAMGALTKVAGIVGLAAVAVQLSQWSGSFTSAKVNSDALTSSLTELGATGRTSGAALDAFKQGWGPFSQDVHSSGQAIQTFGELAKGAIGGANESWLDWIGRMQSGSDRMGHLTAITQQYDAALSKMVSGGSAAQAKTVFDQLSASAQKQGVSVDEIRKLFPQYAAAVTTAGSANAAAAGPTAALGAAQKDAAAAAKAQAANLKALTGALTASNNATLIARGGEDAYYAALDAVSGAVKANGRTLDVHSEKGRANRGVLDSLASAGLSYLGVIQKNNGVGPVFRRTLDQQWQKLYAAAQRFGATRAEARKYADQILATPKALATRVTTPGLTTARAGIRALATDISKINGRTVTFHYQADGRVLMTAASGAAHIARAAGGPIPGFSPNKTADNVPVAATAGEHMWSVPEVEGAGGHENVARLRSLAKNGALPQFLAAGGPVTLRQETRLPRDPAQGFMAAYGAGYGQQQEAAQQASLNASGPAGPVPSGAGVARWGPMVHQALSARGLPQSLWDNWMRQIATESGGNPNAVQGNIGDVNNRSGDLAKGLLQVIGATFRAYHVPGTSNNVFDAWANMNAAMNYAKHRYPNMEAVIGHGHGYAAGTSNAEPGWQWVGENGRELVNFRGGENVKTATASRAVENAADDGFVRLHPDTVSQLGLILGAAMSKQAVVLDGQTIAGYVDRSFGRSSLSLRG